MSECREIELRELLPEHMHGRLPTRTRASIEAHLSGCAECRGELELLRSVRLAFAAEPSVDVGAIVRSLPRPRLRQVSRSSTLLRIAAAIAFVSLGGVSLVVARSAFRGREAHVSDSLVAAARGGDSGTSTVPSVATAPRTLSIAAGVSELEDADLEALIGALDKFESAPFIEPVAIPSGLTSRSGLQ